jgi:predicted component of type VI protein secretion system
MTQESLRELLARVHEHLSRSDSVDPQSRRLLGTVMRDIERALQPAGAADAAAQAPRLESLAVRFEVGHPALAETLRELIDALVKAGI